MLHNLCHYAMELQLRLHAWGQQYLPFPGQHMSGKHSTVAPFSTANKRMSKVDEIANVVLTKGVVVVGLQ